MHFKSWIRNPVQRRHCLPRLGTDLCAICGGTGDIVVPNHSNERYCMECDSFWTSGQPLDSEIIARLQRREDRVANAKEHWTKTLRSLTHSWMNY